MTTDPELDDLRREWHAQPIVEPRLRRRLSRGSADRRLVAMTVMAALFGAGLLGARATATWLETAVLLVGTALLMLGVWILSTLDRNDAGGAGAEASPVSTYIAYSARSRRADARRLALGIAAHAAVLVPAGAWLVWRAGDGLTLSTATAASAAPLVVLLLIVSLAVLAKRNAGVRRQLTAFMWLQMQWDEDDRRQRRPRSGFRSRRRTARKTP